MEQNMILLHFYRTHKVFMLNKWSVGTDMEALYVWEANKKTRFYKHKKLEGLVLKKLWM